MSGVVYVCDSCGSIEVRDAVPEGDEWTCGNCGSHAAWEFPPERRAYAESHAFHIQRGLGKGSIFRGASRRTDARVDRSTISENAR